MDFNFLNESLINLSNELIKDIVINAKYNKELLERISDLVENIENTAGLIEKEKTSLDYFHICELSIIFLDKFGYFNDKNIDKEEFYTDIANMQYSDFGMGYIVSSKLTQLFCLFVGWLATNEITEETEEELFAVLNQEFEIILNLDEIITDDEDEED